MPRAKSANIGHALQRIMRCIEPANPDTRHGIFGEAQWTNKDRFSDALLKDLVEHFSSLNLGNDHREDSNPASVTPVDRGKMKVTT